MTFAPQKRYVDMLVTHGWGRYGWFEHLIYQARICFPDRMSLPTGEPNCRQPNPPGLTTSRSATEPPLTFVTERLDGEAVWASTASRESVMRCKKIVRDGIQEVGEGNVEGGGGWFWKVSRFELVPLRSRLIDLQKFDDDVRSAFTRVRQAKRGDEGLLLLHQTLLSNGDELRDAFKKAVTYATKAKLFELRRTLEMVSESGGGLQFVEAPEITPHTPPALSVDLRACKTIRDALGDSFATTLLTVEEFYFTFGLRLNDLGEITSGLRELRPEARKYYDKMGRSAGALVALELIQTIVEAKVDAGGTQ